MLVGVKQCLSGGQYSTASLFAVIQSDWWSSRDDPQCKRVMKFMENIKPLSQRALATCKGNGVSLTFSQLRLNWI